MPTDLRPLRVALAVYTLTSVVALVARAADDDRAGQVPVAGAVVTAFLIAGVLWFFADRRHRWPKWALLALLVIGIGSLISFLDERSLLAVVDLAALVVLLRGWPAPQGSEESTQPGSPR